MLDSCKQLLSLPNISEWYFFASNNNRKIKIKILMIFELFIKNIL